MPSGRALYRCWESPQKARMEAGEWFTVSCSLQLAGLTKMHRYAISSLLLLAVVWLAGPVSAQPKPEGVIVLYHHVAEDTPPSTSISPENFRRHLEYLRDNGFTVVGLDKMVEAAREGIDLPEKSVAITFDDGYESIYTTAFPLLQEFNFPFTLFLSTGPIDRNQPNYMTWANIRDMAEAGVLIANHMVEHPYMLDRTNGESLQEWEARLEQELLLAEARIEEETGQSLRYLAYPYGEFDPQIKAMLQRNSFTGFAQNSGAVGQHSDFLALPRFPLASIYANLETAATKFATRPFNAGLVEPRSPVTTDRSPSVRLRFEPGDYDRQQIGCFANSKPIPMIWESESVVLLQPEEEYGGRRWRYICTAPDPASRRYFWYSVQWIHTGG